MVEVTLYYNADKNIVAQKHLTPEGTCTGDFRATADVLRPTLVLQGTVPASVNYVYIPDFRRYYYVSERREITKDLTQLMLYVDVRKSFYNNLIANKGIVARNTNNYNMYLPDNRIPISARKALSIKKFTGDGPFAAGAKSISMTVFGGGPTWSGPFPPVNGGV